MRSPRSARSWTPRATSRSPASRRWRAPSPRSPAGRPRSCSCSCAWPPPGGRRRRRCSRRWPVSAGSSAAAASANASSTSKRCRPPRPEPAGRPGRRLVGAPCGRAIRSASTFIFRSARSAARTATSPSTRGPRSPTTPTPTRSSPSSPRAARWFDGAGPLVSIYFGGGTPGLWRPDALGRVIDGGARHLRRAPTAARAGDHRRGQPGRDRRRPAAARCAAQGVNRLSIGVAGARRSAAGGARAQPRRGGRSGRGARRAGRGFDDVSIDLMFGVPGQSLDDWRRAVDAAIALAPEHVSAYALTIERGTVFGARDRAGQLPRPDDEAVAAMFEHARAAFAAAGLAPYEVSSYACPGRRARHNRLYWSLAPYLGVGASAASFRPLADGGGWRFSNPRATDVYLRGRTGGEPGRPPRRAADRRRSRERGGLAGPAHRRRDRPRGASGAPRARSAHRARPSGRLGRGSRLAGRRRRPRSTDAGRRAVCRRDRRPILARGNLMLVHSPEK